MKTRIAAFVSVVIGGMLIFNPLKALQLAIMQ